MELHESLAQLARDHGHALFTEADAFRGALDDYLDEGSASTGTINLLTDAVRLGALQGMLSMLDSGAGVEDAVDSAGRRLSRDRGSADVSGSQWACAVLGYALGRVPESLATRLHPDALTAEPPASERPLLPPGPPPTAQRPAQSPAPTGWPGSGGAPTQRPASHSPQAPQSPQSPQSPQAPAQPAAFGQYGAPSPYGGHQGGGSWGAPPKKNRTGLLVGLAAVAVVLVVGIVVGIVALSGGDDDEPSADDDTTSETTEPTEPTEPTESTNVETSTTDPELTLSGDGYSYQLPNEEWTDVTSETPDDSGTIDTIAVLGNALNTGRGNILVESSSAYGESDVSNLEESWKGVLESSTGATPVEAGDITIGGEPAVGVELEWTNDNNFAVRQVAYLVVWGDKQYSITASFKQGDQGFEDIYQDVLETWSWE